jgi:hypothetical protein
MPLSRTFSDEIEWCKARTRDSREEAGKAIAPLSATLLPGLVGPTRLICQSRRDTTVSSAQGARSAQPFGDLG